MSYLVVTKKLSGIYKGFVTHNSFDSKQEFDKWRKEAKGYHVVAAGISEEDASAICAQCNTLEVLLEIAIRNAVTAPPGEQRQVFESSLGEIISMLKSPLILAAKYFGVVKN
ncbi:MAG: hypothetical protein V1702_00935 [Candidatus Woesearchaeota archaeon]